MFELINYIKNVLRRYKRFALNILIIFTVFSVSLLLIIQLKHGCSINYYRYYMPFFDFYHLRVNKLHNFFSFFSGCLRISLLAMNNYLLLDLIDFFCSCIKVFSSIFFFLISYVIYWIYMYYQFLDLLLDLVKLFILKTDTNLDAFILKHPTFNEYTLILERPGVTKVVFYLLIDVPDYYNSVFSSISHYCDSVSSKVWFFFEEHFSIITFVYSLVAVPLSLYLALLNELGKYWVQSNFLLLETCGRLLNFFVFVLFPKVDTVLWLEVVPYPVVVISFLQKSGHPWGTSLLFCASILAVFDRLFKTYLLEYCIFAIIIFIKNLLSKLKLYFKLYKINCFTIYMMLLLLPMYTNIFLYKFTLFILIDHVIFWRPENNVD